ncbi:MAG: BlaI/MecI/CopY family transcriptional regulator [Clostridia bacterium]|nr:BlaI/MecI/CopY family transcriptional regulator [Clostridia bacterium]
MKVHDSELKVLEVLWANGPQTAAELSRELKESTGWSRNTTYTILKRCAAKSLIRRDEPHFLCTALVSRDEVRTSETDELIGRMFGGSRRQFFSALIADERLSEAELEELRDMIDARR